MILFIDTETTGKADFQSPPDAPHQPRMVQLAAILRDEKEVIEEYNTIVMPDGYEIPAEAAAIHGITTEIAREKGVPISHALGVIHGLSRRVGSEARAVAAHNASFDHFILWGEFRRFGEPNWFGRRDGGLPWECTMLATTPICRLPGKFRNKFKWPKLEEAYRHAFNEEIDGAHDALADVRACARIYYWLQAANVERY